MDGRGDAPRGTGICVTISGANELIALQDANCTTEGGELDFGKAGADAAKKPARSINCRVANAVLVGLEECFGAVVHRA